MILKEKWKQLLICIALPLIVGGISALLTRNSMDTFAALNKPLLSPPGWLFPVVWTILYVLMGIASYLVLTSGKEQRKIKQALWFYKLQLCVNFFWPIYFFVLSVYLFSFIWLLLLWILIIGTTIRFYRITNWAGYLMIPYLLWVTFAGYLNYSIYLLN